MPRRLIITCLLALACLIPSAAFAQESEDADSGPDADASDVARLVIQPAGSNRGFFDLVLEPGEEIELAIELVNNGDRTGTGLFYATDAYTRVNGGFGGRMQDDPVSGMTEWVSLDTEQILLEPETGVERNLTVRVPEDAAPGEYISALVFENRELARIGEGEGVQLNQRSRDLIALFIDVPGPRDPGFSIGNLSHRESTRATSIVFDLDNSGNQRLNLSGNFRIEDDLGNQLLERHLEMQVFYAGHQTSLEVGLGDLLQPGDYRVWLLLEDSDKGVFDSVEGVGLNIPEPESDDDQDSGITGLIQPPRLPGDDGSGSWLTLLAIIVVFSALATVIGVLIGRRRQATGATGVTVPESAPQPNRAAQAAIHKDPRQPVPQPVSGRGTTPRMLKPMMPPKEAD